MIIDEAAFINCIFFFFRIQINVQVSKSKFCKLKTEIRKTFRFLTCTPRTPYSNVFSEYYYHFGTHANRRDLNCYAAECWTEFILFRRLSIVIRFGQDKSRANLKCEYLYLYYFFCSFVCLSPVRKSLINCTCYTAKLILFTTHVKIRFSEEEKTKKK